MMFGFLLFSIIFTNFLLVSYTRSVARLSIYHSYTLLNKLNEMSFPQYAAYEEGFMRRRKVRQIRTRLCETPVRMEEITQAIERSGIPGVEIDQLFDQLLRK